MIKKISSVILAAVLFVSVVCGQAADADKIKNQTTKAINYGLVIDNSASMRAVLEEVIKSAETIAESNASGDEAFVVRFAAADNIDLVQDFTGSTDELKSALDDLFIEGGLSALLDGVYFSAKHLAEKENSSPDARRILIIISDGEERGSVTKSEILLKFLKEEKIKVYALGLFDEKIHKNFLEKLAKETGGKIYIVQNRSELKDIVRELTAAVRAQ